MVDKACSSWRCDAVDVSCVRAHYKIGAVVIGLAFVKALPDSQNPVSFGVYTQEGLLFLYIGACLLPCVLRARIVVLKYVEGNDMGCGSSPALSFRFEL